MNSISNDNIRLATDDDLAKIQSVARRTIDGSYRGFLGNDGVDAFLKSGASDRYLLENIRDCWVLVHGEDVVAFCVCKGNLIDLMMVDIDKHRQGFGSQLLRFCEELLFQTHEELKLESFEENDKANRFYRKHGWTATERIFDEESSVSKVKMRKSGNST